MVAGPLSMIIAAWALSGAAIAVGSGRAYLWRAGIWLGPLIYVLLRRDERPAWRAQFQDIGEHPESSARLNPPAAAFDDEFVTVKKAKGARPKPIWANQVVPRSPTVAIAVVLAVILLVVRAALTQKTPAPVSATVEASALQPILATDTPDQNTLEQPSSPSSVQIIQDQPPAGPVAVMRTAVGARYLGIYEQQVASADGRWGMRVSSVLRGTPAEAAGLQVGDVLRSANGYAIEEPGALAWIIANATPKSTLRLVVTVARIAADRTITATLSDNPQPTSYRTQQYPSSYHVPDAVIVRWEMKRRCALACEDPYLAAVYQRHIVWYNQGLKHQAVVSLQSSLDQLSADRMDDGHFMLIAIAVSQSGD